ncbi:MAG: hypothetical protein ACI83P_001208, partial [Janthinobacterium sp.]
TLEKCVFLSLSVGLPSRSLMRLIASIFVIPDSDSIKWWRRARRQPLARAQF